MKKTNEAKKMQSKPAPANARQKAAADPAAVKASMPAKPKSTVKSKAVAKAKPADKVANKSAKAEAPSKTIQQKSSAKPKPVPAAKEKIKKPKLVRDSFTMPETEYAVLGQVKKTCLKAGIDVKKSELLRIGVAHISQLSLLDLKKAIASLVPLKAGRPKKEK